MLTVHCERIDWRDYAASHLALAQPRILLMIAGGENAHGPRAGKTPVKVRMCD